MSHFANTLWVDFARGVFMGDQHAAMQQHLDRGCSSCESAFTLFHKLVVAANTHEIAVPDPIVRKARAIFSAYQPVRPRVTTVFANLLFDSWNAPLTVGVRTLRSVARQTAYEAGPYLIDLRIEQERGNVRTQLTGQIANRSNPQANMHGIRISLFADDELLASAQSSKFGEFQFDFLCTRGEVTLHLEPQGGSRRVQLSLRDLDVTDTRQNRIFEVPDSSGNNLGEFLQADAPDHGTSIPASDAPAGDLR